MSVEIVRIQLASPVSFAGTSKESFVFTPDKEGPHFRAELVQNGVHIFSKKPDADTVCFVPWANVKQVNFKPKPANGKAEKK